MKVVALLPFKNEEQFLPSYCSTVLPVIDVLVAVNDGSDDAGPQILKTECARLGVKLVMHDNPPEDVYYVDRIRKKLLDLGREEGGTHFVCLDADEAFTGNFMAKAKKIFARLEPGQKLTMQWLALWKSIDHYRHDNSPWSNSFKDFVFCEDGTSEVEATFIHEGRTPGVNTEDNNLRLNPKHGAVLHFQFSNWNAFQIKQAWYRCREFVNQPNNLRGINEKYKITMDVKNAHLRAIEDSWKLDVLMPDFQPINVETDWRMNKMKEMFQTHGVEYFKDLNIWHVPEIKKMSECM